MTAASSSWHAAASSSWHAAASSSARLTVQSCVVPLVKETNAFVQLLGAGFPPDPKYHDDIILGRKLSDSLITIINEGDCNGALLSRPLLAGVQQSVDVTEDTDVETTLIAFNGEPLNPEYDFPSGSFDYDGISYSSYEEFCESNDCLNIVQYPSHGTLDTNNISISLDPDNSNFVIMSGGYSPNSNYGDDNNYNACDRKSDPP